MAAHNQRNAHNQLNRPAFSRIADLKVRYLAYSELKENREAIAKFGHSMKPIHAISRALS